MSCNAGHRLLGLMIAAASGGMVGLAVGLVLGRWGR